MDACSVDANQIHIVILLGGTPSNVNLNLDNLIGVFCFKLQQLFLSGAKISFIKQYLLLQ